MKIDNLIKQIRQSIPEIIHYILFYKDGIVVNTSFKEENNIPELGKTVNEIIETCQRFLLLAGIESKDYRKIVYEGINWGLFILQVGEQSHLALIINNSGKEIKIQPIRKYLELIEDAIDVSQEELDETNNSLHESKESEIEINETNQLSENTDPTIIKDEKPINDEKPQEKP